MQVLDRPQSHRLRGPVTIGSALRTKLLEEEP